MTTLTERRLSVASQMRCERCKRFIGEDCLEGVDHSKGMQMDGDVAWTGKFYCASGKGCNRFDDDTVPEYVGTDLDPWKVGIDGF